MAISQPDISSHVDCRTPLGASPCISKRLHYACRPVATLSYLAPFYCSFRPNPPATTKRNPPPVRVLLLVFLLVQLIEAVLHTFFVSGFRFYCRLFFRDFSHLVKISISLSSISFFYRLHSLNASYLPLLSPYFFKHVDFFSYSSSPFGITTLRYYCGTDILRNCGIKFTLIIEKIRITSRTFSLA